MDAKLLQMLGIIRERSVTGGIALADLARQLEVSTRTVRTYVAQTNVQLGDTAHIVVRRGHGYSLAITDSDGFRALLSTASKDGSSHVPQSRSERVSYLLNDLLNRTDWITSDTLAQLLYVSRPTISNDIKEVECELARFGLTLVRKPYHGIRVEGSELNRRLLLANRVLSTSADTVLPQVGKDMLDQIAACVQRATAEVDVQINSAAYQNLLVHIAIAVERIRKNCYVPMAAEQLADIRASYEYVCAERVAELIEQAFSVVLPVEETAYIAIHLAGKRVFYTDGAAEGGIVITDEMWNVVSRMLDRVWEAFRFDFRDDLELRMNLARHIVPLSVRLRYQMSVGNPLLADIKLRLPLAYAMAMESALVLVDAYGSMPAEDEVGYLALAFALAQERGRSGAERKIILVVCASGAGSARLLEHRYREEFGAHLADVIVCDVASLDAVDLRSIDYVFTTVPLSQQLPVPVREVSFFLDGTDREEVRRALTLSGESTSIEGYLDHRLFISHMACRTKEEVIAALCKRAVEVRQAPDELERLVWKRERAATTSFGNRVAMPHPYRAVTGETFVCVGLLDEPVAWTEDVDVQAVFLVCVAKERKGDLQEFYRCMAALLTSERAINTLISQQEFSILLELVHE